jgi:hypothetical protein
MSYNPFLVAVLMLAAAAILAGTALGAAFGVQHDVSLQRALVHVELALAPLFFLPLVSRGRDAAARNALNLAACAAVSAAVVALFSFLTREPVALETRAGALAAWVFAGGWLAFAASLGSAWVVRARVALVCVFALPPLWHYLALEYGGASLLHISWLSPSWAFARDALDWWPLLLAGLPAWLLAARPWPTRHAAKVAAVLLVLAAPALAAQEINTERSRFLSEPHGRPGTMAPYRLNFTAVESSTTVRVLHGNTRHSRTFATTPGQTAEVVVPVFVADGVRIEAGEAVHTPRLPLRRVAPEYEQPYVAVFSADAVYARPVVPTEPGVLVCDYYENREFFTDWRMLDGYDGIIIFQPEAQRLPAGSQQAIAEFCSAGGATIIVGTFELGEFVTGLPAPTEPEMLEFLGIPVQRFGYGPGAVYRVGFETLRDSGRGHQVLRRMLLDHMHFGQSRAPGGPPVHRAPGGESPTLVAGPAEPARVTPFFFVLAGGLLACCLVMPALGSRLRGGRWWHAPVLAALAAGIALPAAMQSGPPPAADAWTVARVGADGTGWTRTYVLAEADWQHAGEVDLAAERALVRPWRSGTGRRGWQVDLPLQSTRAIEPVTLEYGRINDVLFRDYATRAQRGTTPFSPESARLLDWWLEGNSYRGRIAALGEGEWSVPPERFKGSVARHRAVLVVQDRRNPS